MRRGSLLLPALAGVVLAALIEAGDRSSCPIGGGECIVGPTYAWLHPAAPAFNHVFGALVFLAPIVFGVGTSFFLVFRARRQRGTNT